MNVNKEKQQNKTLLILIGVFAVVLVVMILALCIPKSTPKDKFTPPAFEVTAVQGKPEMDSSFGYTELYQDGMAYRVSVCGTPQINGNELTVYFTNTEGNEQYLKLRVLDEKGNILGETGLLKSGEYVKNVTLSKELSAGTKIKLKVMSYEPDDYTSAGKRGNECYRRRYKIVKKCMTFILTALLLLSCSVPTFAAEVSDQTQINVNARAEYNIVGMYLAAIENGAGTVETDDGTTVTVENAPKGAVRLIVVPIPTSEKDAWSWITACLKDEGTPIHTFDIYFVDESDNRINADGAVVTIDCPHCTGKPTVCSLTTSGDVKELRNNARSVSVTFTTDGSHYYVMAEKSSTPVADDKHKVDVKEPTGGKVEIGDRTPKAGDTVTITPKPDTGKAVDKIIVNDKDGNKIDVKDNGDGSYSYEQPDGDVTVEVTFKDKDTGVDDNPQTGDSSHLGLWFILAILSAAGIVISIFLWRRKKDERNEF